MAPSAPEPAQTVQIQLMFMAVIFICFIAISSITFVFKCCQNTIISNPQVIMIPIAILSSTQILFGVVAYRQSYDPLTNPTLEQVLSFITTIIYIGHGIWYLLMTYHLPKIIQPKDRMYTISTKAIYSHRLGTLLLITFRTIDAIGKMKDIKISDRSLDIAEIFIVMIGYSHMVFLFCQRLRRTTMKGSIMTIGVVLTITMHTITCVSMAIVITVRIIVADEL